MNPNKHELHTRPTRHLKRIVIILVSVLFVTYMVASAVFMADKVSNYVLPEIGFWLRGFEDNGDIVPQKTALAQINDCQVQIIAKKSRGKDGYNVLFTYRKDGHVEVVDYRKFPELKAAAIKNNERCGGIAIVE